MEFANHHTALRSFSPWPNVVNSRLMVRFSREYEGTGAGRGAFDLTRCLS